jgi:hypothetical protein
MISPNMLALLQVDLHRHQDMSFLFIAALGVAFFVWALARGDRKSV